jgi:hypothetical protein
MNQQIFEIKNAVIEYTQLGKAGSKGLLSCWLMLDYGGTGQGFGGWCFDTLRNPRSTDFERVGTAWGMEFVRRVLATVGVDDWEDLQGKHVRVKATHSKVIAIGHIIKDRWFDPEIDLAFLKEAARSLPSVKTNS